MDDLKIHWPKNSVALVYLPRLGYSRFWKKFSYAFIIFDGRNSREEFYKQIYGEEYAQIALMKADRCGFANKEREHEKKFIDRKYNMFLNLLFRIKDFPNYILAPKELSRKLDKILEE